MPVGSQLGLAACGADLMGCPSLCSGCPAGSPTSRRRAAHTTRAVSDLSSSLQHRAPVMQPARRHLTRSLGANTRQLVAPLLRHSRARADISLRPRPRLCCNQALTLSRMEGLTREVCWHVHIVGPSDVVQGVPSNQGGPPRQRSALQTRHLRWPCAPQGMHTCHGLLRVKKTAHSTCSFRKHL